MIRMTEELTTFPSIIYSGLWVLKTLGILAKDFKSKNVRIVVLITDAPPAFTITISMGTLMLKFLKKLQFSRKSRALKVTVISAYLHKFFLEELKVSLKG